MVSLFFLECLFIGRAFLHSSSIFVWSRIAWAWGIPFTLELSLVMDLPDKGGSRLKPFFSIVLTLCSQFISAHELRFFIASILAALTAKVCVP